MWPWGHAAVAYLLYSAVRRRTGARPASPAVFALAAGTALPDVVDKTLAWTFAVLPTGRTLAHSLLVLGPLIAVAVWRVSPDRRRRVVAPFGLGAVSHSLTDLPPSVLAGDLSGATFLLWPVLPSPEYDVAQSFLAHFLAFALTPYNAVQFGLAAVAGVVWLADGRPGLATLRAALGGPAPSTGADPGE